jgi:ComF family protein
MTRQLRCRDIFRLPSWPSVCQICHAWPSQPICAQCVERFAQPVRRCPTCALALAPAHTACQHCVNTPSPLDACVSVVSYTFPWADCVTQFKFQANPSLGRSLAHLMSHAPWVQLSVDNAQLVVAMPLSSARLRERGFNQAFELARHLSPDKADAHVLQRLDNTTHQVGTSRDERLAQVQGMFWVASDRLEAVRGRSVVLVDDVMTTGASLYEAARTLRAAGAHHITGLVFARTEAHGSNGRHTGQCTHVPSRSRPS